MVGTVCFCSLILSAVVYWSFNIEVCYGSKLNKTYEISSIQLRGLHEVPSRFL